MFKDNIFIEESEKLINSSNLVTFDEVVNGFKISEVVLNNKEAKELNRNKGKYVTISYDKDNFNVESLIQVLCDKIKSMLDEIGVSNKKKILYVGLGNKDITSDKFGYLCIEKIGISTKTYKIYKNVLGVTNIKSVEFVKNIGDIVMADLVIVFDSLKANNFERLGSTIQISTGGMYPGSLISEKKSELSKRTIKRNVLCIGVPTVINMKSINNENPDLMVSSKDIDRVVDDVSSIISICFNRIL